MALARNTDDADEAAAGARRFASPDVAIVAGTIIAWAAFALVLSGGEPFVFYDTFRDSAYAENIRGGRLLSDPSIAELPWWYAPGNPLLFAAVSAATGASVIDVYASSVYLLNPLVLVLLFVLVRRSWGRAAGAVAVLMAWLGSYWWLTHGLAPMPSIQGVALNIIGLACWQRCASPGWRWPVVTGIALALDLWHHPVCGVILAATIFVHAVSARSILFRNMLIVAAVSGALASPLILHLMRLPKQNLDPFLYVPNEMLDTRFALGWHAPLAAVLGLAGVVLLLRRREAGWLLSYLAVCVVGQSLGYLGHFLKLPIPYLLPHEFQYHGQLALAICAAVAAVELARFSDRHATRAGRLWLPFGRALVFIGVFTFAPALASATHARHYFRYPRRMAAPHEGWLTWLREHTALETTIAADPETAYFITCGMLGRKTVALPPGHANPAAVAEARIAAAREMLSTSDPTEFRRLARLYDVDYLLVTAADLPKEERFERFSETLGLRIAFADPTGRTIVFAIGD